MNQYHAIGIMSGSSMDGVDIAFCSFTQKGAAWSYKIHDSLLVPYTVQWKKKLSSLAACSPENFVQAHAAYGHYLGILAKRFIRSRRIKDLDLVASHGHTVFHRPEKRFTFQLGEGAAIAAACRHTVVSDFRSADVAHGGQGAPLVPVGDRLLFGKYAYCLNLGGIANISFEKKNKRMAYDICPVNMALNELSEQMAFPYDKGGRLAASGKVNAALLQKLEQLPYYRQSYPKSLGKEWYNENFSPLLEKYDIPVADKLRTVTEHIALRVAAAVNESLPGSAASVLVTGGGAFNRFLIDAIGSRCNARMEVPGRELVKFKEAMVFAFLGVLRIRQEPNCLSSVTGASGNVCGGAIFPG